MLGAIPAAQPSSLTTEETIAALVEALDDDDGEVRANIAMALANLGPAAVTPLIVALEDSNPRRRGGAAQAIGQIRPPVGMAVTPLLRAMKDKDDDVRRQVSYALSRIIGRSASPAPEIIQPRPPLDPVPNLLGGTR